MRTLLMFLLWGIATPLSSLVAMPWTLLTGDVSLLYRMAMWIALTGVRLAGVRWRLHGIDNVLATKNCIYMSNHVSNLDPPLLIPLLPRRTSVLVKKELFRIPVLATAMRMGSLVPVDRKNREAAVASVKEGVKVLQQGLDMTVFPEGTRSKDGRLLPFKKGPFYMAMESGVPIVPVTILGSELLWPKGKNLVRPGVVDIVFHPPILPGEHPDRDDLMKVVRDAVASALPPERR